IGVTKEITQERLEILYAIYNQNCIEYGIPIKPRKCIDGLTRSDLIGKYTNVYFAVHDGKIIGGLLILWSPQTASYYLSCSLADFRSLQPGVLLIHHALQDVKKRGIRFWNWEGSPSRDSGVYRFKKKWGSVEIPYKIYVQPFKPLEAFQRIGKENLANNFPFYFVYPFNR